MPRCNDGWVRKGDTAVKVTVTPPANPPFYTLKVVMVPRSNDRPVDHVVFDSQQLAAGATWTVPVDYRCTFTLVSSGNQALTTAVEMDGTPVSCSAGSHCQGACKPSGTAGVAGYWTLTTWAP